MRWNDADLFLKILEEPPESATLILLAATPDSLLPTIRSRCLQFHFAPVPAEQIETFLKDRVGRETRGAQIGRATFRQAARARRSRSIWRSRRGCAGACCSLLEQAVAGEKYGEIFAATAQLAKQEQESFENILALFYSLLTDLLESSQSPKSSLPRNPDLRREMEALGKKIDWDWVLRATRGLDTLEGRLRRNIGRQLGLDALVASLSIR